MYLRKFWIIPVFIILSNLNMTIEAQSVRRQVIGSFGSSGYLDGITISQTVGQSFSTIAYRDGQIGINPGFQQSNLKGIQLEIKNLPADISIYPNPASSYILFETSKSVRKLNLRVIDLSGKIVFNALVPDLKDYKLNCADWPAGMYAIIITGNDYSTSFTSKLIITK